MEHKDSICSSESQLQFESIYSVAIFDIFEDTGEIIGTNPYAAPHY